MNERLQQLKEQAEFVGDRYALPDEFAKQFADLIVQECISNLYLHGYDDAITQVKKHFGVEE